MDSRAPRVSQVSLLPWEEADPGAGSAEPSPSAGPQSPDISLQAHSGDFVGMLPSCALSCRRD